MGEWVFAEKGRSCALGVPRQEEQCKGWWHRGGKLLGPSVKVFSADKNAIRRMSAPAWGLTKTDALMVALMQLSSVLPLHHASISKDLNPGLQLLYSF